MAGRRTSFRSSKSIAGATLVGLGMFILYGDLAGAVAGLSHVLGANGSETLGVMPALVLAVSQGMQARAMNHQRVLQGLLQQMLVSSWPLLLVTFGTVLSRDAITEKSQHVQENNADSVALASTRSSHE